ncbi:hypothetical protein [Arcticibacter sp.]|uniref:hypothetical protein n=1 Tax=Arcticibacter sp. TaxID=1872630 RepID=UPI00388DF16F
MSKYRIRYSLIGFNFRKEYFEYLEVRDVELRKYGQLEAQEIRFDAQAEADQLLMLSVSLLAYSETRMEEGYVLLNSKAFSPCGIIAAFAAEEAGAYPSGPVNMELNEEQQTRAASFSIMCYEGNRLLRDWKQRKETAPTATTKTQAKTTRKRTADKGGQAGFPIGKRVSFSSKP